jgi:oxygen-independent coproporphyrinogen-3 oxidase
MSAVKVNLDLIKKYNVPGPRYTSYPPATHFTGEFDPALLQEKIRENNATQRDLSLYFHLPFCQTLCWFCGCTTVITTKQSNSATYLDYIEKEMAHLKKTLNPRKKVVQMHYGGGTPTFLTPEELRRLGALIHKNFIVGEDAEAGVEVDPRRLTRDHVVALRESGFNRASMGIQDHDPKVQEAVHRIQPYEETKRAMDWIREAGFSSINVDLIYGLPFQTASSFEKTLDDVLKLKPDRFAVFSYAHVPWIKPAQKILTSGVLPSAEVKLDLLRLTIEKLTSEGFVYIGMDHFARPDDELAVAQKKKTLQRNFQGYSTHGGADIYAFGMSSISQIETAYWQNIKELPDYYAAVDAGKLPAAKAYFVSEDDKVRRTTIMRLMCDMGIDFAAMSQLLGLDFKEYFADELDSLADLEGDGLIARNETGVVVTETGRLLIRNIAMRFDAYSETRKEGKFSRTI